MIKTAVFIVILAVYLWVWKEMSIRMIIFFLIPYSLYASISIAGIMLDKSPSEVVKGVISSLQAPDSRPEPPQPELQQAPPPDPVTTTTTTLPATQDELSAVPAASVATQTPDPKPEVMESSAGSDTPQRQTWKSPGKVTYQNDRWTYTNDLGMTFAYIPPGKFWMGSPEDEPGRGRNESPRHHVEISTGFFMQTTEVTQGQWKAVMEGNPSYFKDCGDDCPVEQVSWNDVQRFIERLNEREGEKVYRLPTEAEWEYAARAGTTTPFAFGDCLSTDDANYHGNYPLQGCPKGGYRGKTIPVGSLESNAWGLYDMHGNVWEWCQDWFDSDYYIKSPEVDPQGPDSGEDRVFRGGSWVSIAVYCRSAYRGRFSPENRNNNLGFRLLRSSP